MPEKPDQAPRPSQVWDAAADLEQGKVADRSAVLEPDCSSADKAVLWTGWELDQVVVEVAVSDLAAAVLDLAAPALVADQVVPTAAVPVRRMCYRAVEAAVGKERHTVLYSEARKASQQQQQHLV